MGVKEGVGMQTSRHEARSKVVSTTLPGKTHLDQNAAVERLKGKRIAAKKRDEKREYSSLSLIKNQKDYPTLKNMTKHRREDEKTLTPRGETQSLKLIDLSKNFPPAVRERKTKGREIEFQTEEIY